MREIGTKNLGFTVKVAYKTKTKNIAGATNMGLKVNFRTKTKNLGEKPKNLQFRVDIKTKSKKHAGATNLRFRVISRPKAKKLAGATNLRFRVRIKTKSQRSLRELLIYDLEYISRPKAKKSSGTYPVLCAYS